MKIFALAIMTLILLPLDTMSQHEGTLTQTNVTIGNCVYSSITVKFTVGTFFGEPTVNGTYEVTGDESCRLPYSTIIWLKISDGAGNRGYIRLSPTIPTVNEGYGYNFSGSPNWNSFICGYQGTRQNGCMNAEGAKNLFLEGEIQSFIVAW